MTYMSICLDYYILVIAVIRLNLNISLDIPHKPLVNLFSLFITNLSETF